MPATATNRTPVRDARLEARVPQKTKDLWKRAATAQGTKVTEFVVNSATEAAHRILRESEFADLTRRDKIAFVEALLSPQPPNARLRKAATRHAQVFGR